MPLRALLADWATWFASFEEQSLAVVLLREIGCQFKILGFSPFLFINIFTDNPGLWYIA
jgi:hypothetical protein